MINEALIVDDVLDSAIFNISQIKPSEWAEQNRFMTSEVSPKQGMFSYENAPYCREIIDCLDPAHPAREIAVMKGAQIGFSTSVIENGIGYIISQQPGNILFLVGHEKLVKDAVKKVDIMLDSTGLRDYIGSQVNRAKNNKSGDTDDKKEFSGGELRIGIANHGELRNISMRYGFIDDYESMRGSSKKSGSTASLIRQRFAAYKNTMKLFYISTPELLETSNIYPQYLRGDQRKYNIPCPCCGEKISFEWTVESEKFPGETAGITWQLDEKNQLIDGSVGYTCPKCAGFFDDRNKSNLLLFGEWIPTATPVEPGIYSYHISALYAPTYMDGWDKYVRQYLEANPPGGTRDEELHQTFMNLGLGLPYEPEGVSVSAESLQHNIQAYEIATIPEKLSIEQGNGKIVMLTLGADMNGKVDDARLDWEIQAWSETGSSYSVSHGSIGTFVLKRDLPKHDQRDRRIYTYEHNSSNSVWFEFQELLNSTFKTDTGREMPIFVSAMDTAPYTQYSYPFIDSSPSNIFGVKGDKLQGSGLYTDADYRPFMPSKERGKLWILNVNFFKDVVSTQMNLPWNKQINPHQPAGFMNFPQPGDGKYLLTNYFAHFAAEHKVPNGEGRFTWRKKPGDPENHQFDCRIYGYASRQIMLYLIFKELKIQNGVWADLVELINKQKTTQA